jgi:hypothetical protein
LSSSRNSYMSNIPNTTIFPNYLLIGLPGFINFGSWAFSKSRVPSSADPLGMPMSTVAACDLGRRQGLEAESQEGCKARGSLWAQYFGRREVRKLQPMLVREVAGDQNSDEQLLSKEFLPSHAGELRWSRTPLQSSPYSPTSPASPMVVAQDDSRATPTRRRASLRTPCSPPRKGLLLSESQRGRVSPDLEKNAAACLHRQCSGCFNRGTEHFLIC